MENIVEIKNLGKKYIITHQSQSGYNYEALRDVFTNKTKNIFKKISGKKANTLKKEEFWALRDVNFVVNEGERIGIIGRNGAGKSTILKLMSRITEPSEGKIKIKGKVASLLEVGTGFHPELTGRENIFLNGAILGMPRSEIQRKFSQIVELAEIEKFVDTPVKRYSSGMYVRLAFSVAAHLNSDILLIDEVLAVGDAKVKKKSLNKMDTISKEEGRTVLFVSHNLTSIESLCSRGILLNNGKIILDSNIDKVISTYLKDIIAETDNLDLNSRIGRIGTGKIIATSFRVLNNNFNEVHILQSGKDYYFEIGYLNKTCNKIEDVIIGLDLYDDKNAITLLFRTNFTNGNLILDSKEGYIYCKICNLPLANSSYHFSIFISHTDFEICDYIENVGFISVEGGDFFGTGNVKLPSHCIVLHKAEWFTKNV